MRKYLLAVLAALFAVLVCGPSFAFPGQAWGFAAQSHGSFTQRAFRNRGLPRYTQGDVSGNVAVPLLDVFPFVRGVDGLMASSSMSGRAYSRERSSKKGLGSLARGIPLGDYNLIPLVVFSTDNRYDNANSREYALRQDLDWLAARNHGDVPMENPLSRMLQNRGKTELNSPSMKLVRQIQQAVNTPQAVKAQALARFNR